MKRVGEILKEERVKKNLSIDDVFLRTKIPKRFLMAIEADHYSRLPRGLYPQLYIKKYARFLDLSEEKMAAFYRRDCPAENEERVGIFGINFYSVSNWQKLVVGLLFFLIFGGYLFYQYFSFVRPPGVKLKVDVGLAGEKVINGKTDPQATLKIEGEVISLDENGEFSYIISDSEKKEITVIVESLSGKVREVKKEL